MFSFTKFYMEWYDKIYVFILWLIILVIKDYPLEVFQPQQ